MMIFVFDLQIYEVNMCHKEGVGGWILILHSKSILQRGLVTE
jgi:hypothetical protein